jgi:uncharacterized membrane protein YhfC
MLNVLICFGIPIVGTIWIGRKYGRVLKPFLIGAAAFTLSQLVLRIPLITMVLPNFTWYQLMQLNPYLSGVFLGLTAGIFEETARLIFMKQFLKNRTRKEDGLAFGLGHGGIEAMLLVGINGIVTMFMYPAGYIDLADVGYLTILISGLERISALMFPVGASLIVLYGIRIHHFVRYTFLAILLHALLDSMLVILPASIGLGTMGLEIYILVLSGLVLLYGYGRFIRIGNESKQRQDKQECNI